MKRRVGGVKGGYMSNIIMWILIGLGAGFLVNVIMPSKSGFLAGTVFAGVVGAFVGGIIYSAFSLGRLASYIDPISFLTAAIGAVFLLFLINILLKSENKEGSSN